ncbi:MAG: HNH endonuclease [Oceanobacillus sp.]|nr:HNH endonuclease [Oceanobacillus sp.]
MMKMSRSYRELSDISDYVKRFEYLKLGGSVGELTFNGHRYLNQKFYTSDPQWLKVKQQVILRDEGCDMGHPDFPIYGKILIHHINPITIDDLIQRKPCIFDLDNLVCVCLNTHNAIHYGDSSLLKLPPVERRANDTCPWR